MRAGGGGGGARCSCTVVVCFAQRKAVEGRAGQGDSRWWFRHLKAPVKVAAVVEGKGGGTTTLSENERRDERMKGRKEKERKKRGKDAVFFLF